MILLGVEMIFIVFGFFVIRLSFWLLGFLLILVIIILVLVLCNGWEVLFSGVILNIWVCSLVVIKIIILVVFGFVCDICCVVVVRVKLICFLFWIKIKNMLWKWINFLYLRLKSVDYIDWLID